MTDTAVNVPYAGLTQLQQTEVRKRMAAISDQIKRGQLKTIQLIDAAIDQATRNLSYNRKHFMQALQDQAGSFTTEQREGLSDEVCKFLGITKLKK